jgi:hypothetical protein
MSDTQPGQRGHVAQLARQLFFEDSEEREMPGLDDVSNLTGEVLADSGELWKVISGGKQAANALRQALDDAGRATIGADTKLVLALDLEEFHGLIEHDRYFCVLHWHRRKTHQAKVYRVGPSTHS